MRIILDFILKFSASLGERISVAVSWNNKNYTLVALQTREGIEFSCQPENSKPYTLKEMDVLFWSQRIVLGEVVVHGY